MRWEVGSVKTCRDQGGNGQNDGIPDFTRSSLLYSYNQSRKKRLLSCFTYSPEPGERALFQLGETPELVFTERTRESDRKSTRLNSSNVRISYAVFCLK